MRNMDNLLERYTIKFDDNNPNAILIYEDKKLINMIALPPIKKGIDIINIFNEEMPTNYAYNFGGFVVITRTLDRTLYYKGITVDVAMRIDEKVLNERLSKLSEDIFPDDLFSDE